GRAVAPLERIAKALSGVEHGALDTRLPLLPGREARQIGESLTAWRPQWRKPCASVSRRSAHEGSSPTNVHLRVKSRRASRKKDGCLLVSSTTSWVRPLLPSAPSPPRSRGTPLRRMLQNGSR